MNKDEKSKVRDWDSARNNKVVYRIPNRYEWDKEKQAMIAIPLTLEEEAQAMVNDWHSEYDTGYLFSAKRSHVIDAIWHAKRLVAVLEDLLKNNKDK